MQTNRSFYPEEVSAYASEAINLLEKFIAIPSFSREEEAAADALEQFIKAKGLNCRRKGNNIWLTAEGYDATRPTLLLNAHIDTVRPTAGWIRPPFEATHENGCLYGLGSNDCGGGLVALLQTFRLLSRRDQPYNLIYLASCEEEVSGKQGIEMVLPFLPPVDVAIVGEPTGMQPAIAEKGLMVLDVTAHGQGGHAARDEGVNAIYEAMEDIEWFRSFRFKKVSPMLGAVKMTVTVIQAGTQHNVVPAECRFTVDVRSNELYSNHEIFDEICRNVKSEVQARSFRLNSSRIDPCHPLVRSAIGLGRIPYGSPTLSDQALMPFPSLKMGPGDSARSHTADEYIKPAEIHEAIRLYLNMLDGLHLR